MDTDLILSEDGKLLIGPTDYHIIFLEVPESVETIHSQAFDGCNYLSSVWIPASVNYIGPAAFLDCPIDMITFANPDAYACKVELNTFDQTLYDNCTLRVPKEGIDSYRNHPVFSHFRNISD